MEWYDLIFRTISETVGRDYTSVLGLIVRIVSLPFTMWKVSKSKATADAAKRAVDQVKKDLAAFDAVTALSAVATSLEEIKDLHRAGAWQHLPRRYSSVRKSIIELRTACPNLAGKDTSVLNTIILHLKIMEGALDRTRCHENHRDVVRLNRTVSDIQDRLNELGVQIKTQIGR